LARALPDLASEVASRAEGSVPPSECNDAWRRYLALPLEAEAAEDRA